MQHKSLVIQSGLDRREAYVQWRSNLLRQKLGNPGWPPAPEPPKVVAEPLKTCTLFSPSSATPDEKPKVEPKSKIPRKV